MIINSMKLISDRIPSFGTMRLPAFLLLTLSMSFCKEKEVEDQGLTLPYITLKEEKAAVPFQYLGSIEGTEDVEIRPQVDGIIEKFHVDEGQYVKKGQPLMDINQQPYLEDLRNASANVQLEEAKLRKAKTELDRLQPLIENAVISEVQQKTSQADYEVAQASLEKAKAAEANMRIKLEFTTIKAPVSGFVGRFPKSVGNVVKQTDSEPLTVLSNVNDVYVYFSMSESDYLLYQRMKMDTTSQSMKMNPNVKLVLADGSIYDHPGIVDATSGQIDRATGSISLRAKFSNPDTLLRLGNTGKILMEQIYPKAVMIPQGATVSIQDKKFVFVLKEDDTAERREIEIEGISGNNYIVKEKTLSANDRIITSGLDKLANGVKVNPITRNRVPN